VFSSLRDLTPTEKNQRSKPKNTFILIKKKKKKRKKESELLLRFYLVDSILNSPYRKINRHAMIFFFFFFKKIALYLSSLWETLELPQKIKIVPSQELKYFFFYFFKKVILFFEQSLQQITKIAAAILH
jgi:hypothetical protein